MLWIVKRLVFTAKLKRVCNKRGYSLIPLRKRWAFGSIHGERSDVCIVTPDAVYSVKLVASHYRRVYYCFDSPTCYSVASWRFPLRATQLDIPYTYHKKPRYTFSYTDDNNKEQINVLLFSPTPSCVFLTEENGRRVIRNGDWMGEAVCYGELGFLELLNRIEQQEHKERSPR